MLDCVRQRARKSAASKAKTRAAMQLIGKQFGLNLDSPVLQAALKFAADWEKKTTTKTKELGEWIEYLSYFAKLAEPFRWRRKRTRTPCA